MNAFDFFLPDGNVVEICYECIDEDLSVGVKAEFEIEVFLNGKNIHDDLDAEIRQKIQNQVHRDWQAACAENNYEIKIFQHENNSLR